MYFGMLKTALLSCYLVIIQFMTLILTLNSFITMYSVD